MTNIKPFSTHPLFTILSAAALALAASVAIAGEPAKDAQQRESAQRPASQAATPAPGTAVKPMGPLTRQMPLRASVRTSGYSRGGYSKTLTFTLSTTNPAPPPSPGRALQARKGGSEVAMEGITLCHEGFEIQSSRAVDDMVWVSGRGGTRGSPVGEPKTATPIRTID